MSVAYLALAFLVWNIDLEMCQELRKVREALGLPWAWLLELHGWWHILTAAGAAVYMELIRDLIMCLDNLRQPGIRLRHG
jgi:dihydroceramidase